MDKCIEIQLPGMDESIQFENVGTKSLHISDILNDIISNPSKKNIEGLKILYNQLVDIDNQPTLNLIETIDAQDIGDNLIGNATIEELTKILYQNGSENSKAFLPILSMLRSNGIYTNQSIILLTNNDKINNRIFLGNKYSRIILNPNSETFIDDLYRSLGYLFIEKQINKKRSNLPITNIINKAFNDLYLDNNLDDFHKNNLDNIKKLSYSQRQRAFLNFVLDSSNNISSNSIVKKLLIDLNVQIQGAIKSELDGLKEYIDYEKNQYELDLTLRKSKANIKKEIDDIKLASKYDSLSEYEKTGYKSDIDLISTFNKKELEKVENLIKRTENNKLQEREKLVKESGSSRVKLNGQTKTDIINEAKNALAPIKEQYLQYDKALKRVNKLDNLKRKYPVISDDIISRAKDISNKTFNPTEKLNELQIQFDELNDVNERLKNYNYRKNIINEIWNIYSINESINFTEQLLPNNISSNEESIVNFDFDDKQFQLSSSDLKQFLTIYPTLKYKRGHIDSISISELADILNENNINYDSDTLPITLPASLYQRKFLKDNPKLFSILWQINNLSQIDTESFSPESVIRKKLREYLVYESLDSDYNNSFDFTKLNISSNEESFKFRNPVSQLKSKSKFEENKNNSLIIKFVSDKSKYNNIADNVMLINKDFEVTEIPSSVKNRLTDISLKTSITNLYIDANSTQNEEFAKLQIQQTIDLLREISNITTIDTILLDGLSNFQVSLAKFGVESGLKVKVYTNDDIKFFNSFEEFETSSYESNIQYNFDLDFRYNKNPNIQSVDHKTALLNGEITGLLYDKNYNSNKGQSYRLFHLKPGNVTTLSKTIQTLVTNKINFNPSQFFSHKLNDNSYSVGTYVSYGEKKNAKNYFIVGINDGKYTISNGLGLIKDIDPNELTFIAQSDIISDNGINLVVTTKFGEFVDTTNGFITRINDNILQNLYKDTFEKMSKVTGYTSSYLKSIINESNFQQYEVVEIELIDEISLKDNTPKITVDESKQIISKMSDYLNMNGVKVNVLTSEEMIERGLSEYEFGHPAFIKTTNGQTEIFINIDHTKVTPGSLIHELSHLVLGYVRANSKNYEEYLSMLDKININDSKYNNYRERYKNRSIVDIKEEILADLFSKYFNNYILDYNGLETNFEQLDLKTVFKKMFGIIENVPNFLTNQDLMNMTLNDAVMTTSSIYNKAIDLFGMSKNSITSRRISNIEEQLINNGKLKEDCK